MATLQTLAAQLRVEIGDLGKSFVWQTTADGMTNRFEIPHAPVQGDTMTVQVDGADIPDACMIEEQTGILTFDDIPPAGAHIVVGGTVFRYFTDTDVEKFIDTAFRQHANSSTTSYGSKYTINSLPAVEEYPIVVLASTLALQVMATDASFDIDISAPDGVMIPRSQRYRQLMEMVEARRAQYRDLCVNLGIGLYRIETFVTRRISHRTNRLSPLYIPQEVDDRALPTRIRIPIPTLGAVPAPSDVGLLDLVVKRGDDFLKQIDFPFDLTGYNIDAQIRYGSNGTSTSPLLLCFTIDVPDIVGGTLVISLTGAETATLPEKALWDLQFTTPDGVKTTYLKGAVIVEGDVTRPSDPRATGWRG